MPKRPEEDFLISAAIKSKESKRRRRGGTRRNHIPTPSTLRRRDGSAEDDKAVHLRYVTHNDLRRMERDEFILRVQESPSQKRHGLHLRPASQTVETANTSPGGEAGTRLNSHFIQQSKSGVVVKRSASSILYHGIESQQSQKK
ncbi:hypothetical protein EYF80_000297 [Liparis tanakae]|uniref:HPr domain-containing protein n=1 Tax=Liparis tanakae TaxID=230148 RepID=A0A4Z2JIV7_9TELE|nr:hypothetical protein EYF80_000297 [Liparis tanakae]